MNSPEFPGSPATSTEITIGEPVVRPDGLVVKAIKTESGVHIDTSGVIAGYSDAEIELLGYGNWQLGIVRVAQAAYNGENLLGCDRALNDEIRAINPLDS